MILSAYGVSILRHAAATLLLLTMPVSAYSQLPEVFLPDSVVIVGARKASKTVESTVPVYNISNTDFKRKSINDISDALHRIPGVNLRDYGGLGGLKTVSVRGLGSQHTAVVYDGMTLSDCQSGEVDLSRYSLDNVESIELVIGDNDDIFIPARATASAASLTINSFRRPDPLRPIDLTARIKTGSFGYINPYIRIGHSFSKSVGINLVADYIHADNNYPFKLRNGISTSNERRNNNRINSGHAEINTAIEFTPRSRLSGKLYYYDNDRQLPGPVIYYNNENHEQLRDRNFLAQLHYRGVFSSHWSMQAHGRFNYASTHYHDEALRYPGGELNQNYFQREAYAGTCVLWIPCQQWAVDYSADYIFNNLNSNLITDRRPFRHSILQSLTGRYQTKQITATARLLASIINNGAGNGKGSRNARRLSPSASVALKLLREENFYARMSYKEIFRMPTFNETYFYHYGNPDVRPETARQINFGLTWQNRPLRWLPMMRFTADVYINNVTDKIVGIPYTMFVWTVVNLDKVRIAGIDITTESVFAPGRGHRITVAGNYSYQHAVSKTAPGTKEYNKQVAYIPLHSGSVSIGYENPWGNLSASLTGISHRFASNDSNPATRIAGYAEVSLTAWRTFRLQNHSLELKADILNLLDKQYSIVARYPMPGRSWRITMTFTL